MFKIKGSNPGGGIFIFRNLISNIAINIYDRVWTRMHMCSNWKCLLHMRKKPQFLVEGERYSRHSISEMDRWMTLQQGLPIL